MHYFKVLLFSSLVQLPFVEKDFTNLDLPRLLLVHFCTKNSHFCRRFQFKEFTYPIKYAPHDAEILYSPLFFLSMTNVIFKDALSSGTVL